MNELTASMCASAEYAKGWNDCQEAFSGLMSEIQALFDAETDRAKLRLSYYDRAGVTVYPAGRDSRVQELRQAFIKMGGKA